ncbi:MAG: EAL domain-containing protein [Candidatus Nanopelagicales bacterium]|nr:EAL domain-containing protein [Candidatus Nanopelagicales bacterium]
MTDGLHGELMRQLSCSGLPVPRALKPGSRFVKFLALVSATYQEFDPDDRTGGTSSSALSALAVEKNRLEAVFNTTATGLCVIDAEQRVSQMNAAAALMLEVDADEATGGPLADLIRPDARSPADARSCSQLVAAVAESSEWRAPMVSLRTGQGGVLPASLAFTPLSGSCARGFAGGVLAISDMTQQERMAWQASHDSLTGLRNRASITKYLSAGAGERPRPFTLLFIDLDHFKTVNDTLGHSVGDQLLVAAGARLRQVTRPGDVIARLGGDEFVVALPGLTQPQAKRMAERILSALRRPYEVGGERVYSSASIGVLSSRATGDANAILRDADLAMYSAKGSGRDRFAVFDEQLRVDASKRAALETRLRGAMARGELQVAYQPLFSIATPQLVGFEALVRWPDSSGYVEPMRFIPVAEESGLIGELGRRVLLDSLGLVRRLHASHERGLYVAVNLSGMQLSGGDLPDLIRSALARSGVSGSELRLELTESVLLENKLEARRQLEEIRGLGVRISLDDFGTGQSSMSLLHEFPLDSIKIDRSFVAGVTTDRSSRAIVEAIIGLGHSLGYEVVAEGVEAEEQMAELMDMGCDVAQGFLLGRPLPASQAVALAAEWVPSQRHRAPDGAAERPAFIA